MGLLGPPEPMPRSEGLQGNRASSYITDTEFNQVEANTHVTVMDAMDLALLTGERPADVLKLKRTDIWDGSGSSRTRQEPS